MPTLLASTRATIKANVTCAQNDRDSGARRFSVGGLPIDEMAWKAILLAGRHRIETGSYLLRRPDSTRICHTSSHESWSGILVRVAVIDDYHRAFASAKPIRRLREKVDLAIYEQPFVSEDALVA